MRESSPRDVEITAANGKIAVCIGVRRCGKSTLMEQHLRELEAQGVARENMVIINFADERLAGMQKENWAELYEAYYSMYPQKRFSEKVYFCFDEIQMQPHWELFVERLRREENCEIYITGSSAKMLSREIHTALRGRTLTWELFPFSFGEYLERCGIARRGRSTTYRMQMLNAWERYKTEGGFPEAFGQGTEWRRRLFQDYFDTLLYRDVIERHNVSQPIVLRELARRMLSSIGSRFSVNKVCNDLRSQGLSIGKETLMQYMEWLEDAYFLFSVPSCTPSVSERFRQMRKIYCIDHAMAHTFCAVFSQRVGQSLENMVYLALRRRSAEIYYYTTEKRLEVDFLAVEPGTQRHLLLQVSSDMSAPTTRHRELRALQAAMAETRIATGYVITEDTAETISTPGGTIRLIPAAEFLALANPWTVTEQ